MADAARALNASKADLRHLFRERRASLPPDLVGGWSAAIAARAAALDAWTDAAAVHCFFGALAGEVRTAGLIERALHQRKRVLSPLLRPHGQLEHREVSSIADYRPAAFGLLEPDADTTPPADPSGADLIFVPGVAFAPDGGRLGMGGGYYDRLLARCAAARIGLAFEMQLAASSPQSPHDQRVDLIVTELRVIRCR